ncbi:hypothetical protein NP233_g8285 [Leucocoprinus birnbaumii]|uniref:Uncharacterized protein n=1 Tax=Leucocoprinus birnbaumii TaxID=56174 RepID=A0AAD5VP90_9AGAR|nr:hypothetical protein NP233_g8285 [Leucocoprinus birnbaumii]
MPRISTARSGEDNRSKPRSQAALRKENDGRLRIYFCRAAGRRPPNSSLNKCTTHGIRRWRLCTGTTTRSLINAGRWFAMCHKCGFFRWGTPALDFASLFAQDTNLRVLYERRERLGPKAWKDEVDPLLQAFNGLAISGPSIEADTMPTDSTLEYASSDLTSDSMSALAHGHLDLVFWTSSDSFPQVIKVPHRTGEAIALSDHETLLDGYGIKSTGSYQTYDPDTKSWDIIEWNTYTICEDEEKLVFRLASVSNCFEFNKFA